MTTERGIVAELFPGATLDELLACWRDGRWHAEHDVPLCRERLQSLPQFADVDSVFRGLRGPMSAYCPRPGAEVVHVQGLRPVQARQLFALGATVICIDADRYVPGLRAVAHELAAGVGVPASAASCIVFLSPAGAATSFACHFDPFDTINCQLRGEKTWYLARNEAVQFPGHHWPLGAAEMRAPGVRYLRDCPELPSGPEEPVVMRPGSALFNPRGYWHRTGDVGDEHSIAVSFMFHVEGWEAVVRRALHAVLSQDASWRQPAVGLCGDARLHDRERMIELLDQLRRHVAELGPDELVDRYRAAVQDGVYREYKTG